MKSIYGMTPVNRAASMVTSQNGCEDELTKEQFRDNLKQRLLALYNENEKTPKSSPNKKNIGKEISELQSQMNSIRPKKKCPGVQQFFIDVARENLSNFEFKRLMNIASERMRNEISNKEDKNEIS